MMNKKITTTSLKLIEKYKKYWNCEKQGHVAKEDKIGAKCIICGKTKVKV